MRVLTEDEGYALQVFDLLLRRASWMALTRRPDDKRMCEPGFLIEELTEGQRKALDGLSSDLVEMIGNDTKYLH